MIFFIRSPCSFIRLISGDIECHVGERPSADVSVVAIVRVIFVKPTSATYYSIAMCPIGYRRVHGRR